MKQGTTGQYKKAHPLPLKINLLVSQGPIPAPTPS